MTDLNDELKVKFDRDMGGETRTSFAPTTPRPSATVEAEPLSQNEVLLAEIRALQPKEKEPPPPAKAPVDVRAAGASNHARSAAATTKQRSENPTRSQLNGINPAFLVLGAVSYGTLSYFAWQFTGAAAEYFAEHPMDSAFYFVQRLSSLARVIVIGLGALGTGVTAIAGAGQLALAVQVAIGIAKG